MSEQEPMAWAVWVDPLEPTLCVMEGDAEALGRTHNAKIEPLYAHRDLISNARDRFAAAAITGLLANPYGLIAANGINDWQSVGNGYRHGDVAKTAYEIADAMLAARCAAGSGESHA